MDCFDKWKKTDQYHADQSKAIGSSERYREAIKNPERMEKMLKYLTKFKITKEELYDVYVLQKISVEDIAQKYGVTPSAVYRKLRRYGMKPARISTFTHKNHTELVSKASEFYKSKYRVVPLVKHIPDIILVDFKENKLYGVEIIGAIRKGRHQTENKRRKMIEAGLFDDVFILTRDEANKGQISHTIICKKYRFHFFPK